MGDGFTGDIAIDDLSFMNCTLYPGKDEYFSIEFQTHLFEKAAEEINISFPQILKKKNPHF